MLLKYVSVLTQMSKTLASSDMDVIVTTTTQKRWIGPNMWSAYREGNIPNISFVQESASFVTLQIMPQFNQKLWRSGSLAKKNKRMEGDCASHAMSCRAERFPALTKREMCINESDKQNHKRTRPCSSKETIIQYNERPFSKMSPFFKMRHILFKSGICL